MAFFLQDCYPIQQLFDSGWSHHWIPLLLRKLKLLSVFTRTYLLNQFRSWRVRCSPLPRCIVNIHFNIIFLCKPWNQKWYSPFRIPTKTFVCVFNSSISSTRPLSIYSCLKVKIIIIIIMVIIFFFFNPNYLLPCQLAKHHAFSNMFGLNFKHMVPCIMIQC